MSQTLKKTHQTPPQKAPQQGTQQPAGQGTSRRKFLQGLALVLAAAPLLKLGETVARAEKRKQHHRGHSTEMWIGHC